MIVIAGRIRIKPGTQADATRAARDMVAATRPEAGCVSYAFYADLEDPCAFFIFEEWENDEALARHFATPHMAAFQAQVLTFIAASPEIKRYVVSSAAAL